MIARSNHSFVTVCSKVVGRHTSGSSRDLTNVRERWFLIILMPVRPVQIIWDKNLWRFYFGGLLLCYNTSYHEVSTFSHSTQFLQTSIIIPIFSKARAWGLMITIILTTWYTCESHRCDAADWVILEVLNWRFLLPWTSIIFIIFFTIR